MDVIKIVGIGLMVLILSMILKEYKKEYALYISLAGGMVILFSCLDQIREIVDFINRISTGTSYSQELVRITFKNYRNFYFSTICCDFVC